MDFHSKDGLHFERLPDGGVRVYVQRRRVDKIVEVAVLNQSEWVSIPAAMCARGETGDTWMEYHEAHVRTD